jgi:hypothetical protein
MGTMDRAGLYIALLALHRLYMSANSLPFDFYRQYSVKLAWFSVAMIYRAPARVLLLHTPSVEWLARLDYP